MEETPWPQQSIKTWTQQAEEDSPRSHSSHGDLQCERVQLPCRQATEKCKLSKDQEVHVGHSDQCRSLPPGKYLSSRQHVSATPGAGLWFERARIHRRRQPQ